jgi:ribosomal protein S18 acetylase RimI-like enzyme
LPQAVARSRARLRWANPPRRGTCLSAGSLLWVALVIVVRAARRADYRDLLPLVCEIRRFHRQALPDMFESDERQLGKYSFQRKLSSPHVAFLVAETGGLIVGYAVVRLVPESATDRVLMQLTRLRSPRNRLTAGSSLFPRTAARRQARRRTAFIDEVVVSPAVRRQGIGSMLTKACVAWSDERRASAVDLQVFDFNRGALQLYRDLGFVSTRQSMRRPLE